MSTPSAAERAALAEAGGVDEQYLYQCLTGRKAMNAKQAVRFERAVGGRVRRWDLRRDDWHEVWPELVGSEGAPPIPNTAQEVRHAA